MSPDGRNWPWSVLELDGRPDDPRDIRRAYARKLKSIDPSTEIEAFEQLRKAYEFARSKSGDAQGAMHSHLSAGHIEIPNPDPDRIVSVVISNLPVNEVNQPHEVEETNASPWEDADPLRDINAVISGCRNLIRHGDWSPSSWERLLSAPALDRPTAASALERDLVFALQEAKSDPEVGFIEVADKRFGWVSDGIGFLRRFPYARDLQRDMATEMRMERMANANVQAKAIHDPRGKPLPPLLWFVPFIAWLYLLVWLR